MTISSTNRKAGPFTGNGMTTAFPFAFKVFVAADLLVVQAVTATGIETAKTLGADYTVSLNADQGANPGGTVTLPVALSSGQTLTVTSQAQNLQPTDLTNQGGFYPRVINDALDRLTIFVQQLALKLSRALVFPLSDGGGNPTLPAKDLRRGAVLAFHETTGDPVVGPRITAVNTVAGAVAAIQTVADDLNEPVSEIEVVANNIDLINTAYTMSAAAIDSAAYLRQYMDQIAMNVTFPLDLGLIADPVIYNTFDLGAL